MDHNSSSLEPSTEENGGRRKRNLWTESDDELLKQYVYKHGAGNWRIVAQNLTECGLEKTAHSCRHRWLNHLSPDIRRGEFTVEEKLLIIERRFEWGNKWSRIAQLLPGRTDNEVKNYWNTHIKKEGARMGQDVYSKEFVHFMSAHLLNGNLQAAAGAGADGSSGSAMPPSSTTTVQLDPGAALLASPSHLDPIVAQADIDYLDDQFWFY